MRSAESPTLSAWRDPPFSHCACAHWPPQIPHPPDQSK
ncbi:hypothetical protein I7I53_08519 [Histoplasma capsulatum var. duboisii H88]|nr:hypothetical protein I7I53_08519 [Histoplasma capsulatum var. duboisii H88]